MQRSSLVLFCDECGLANDAGATHCSAYQRPLARPGSSASAPKIAPVAVTPLPVREVTPGLLFTGGEIYRGTILAECYLIKEEIGRGGFSIVYRAVEVDEPDRQVAIKRIPLSALTL